MRILFFFILFITLTKCTLDYRPHQILRIAIDRHDNHYIVSRDPKGQYLIEKYDKDFKRIWIYDKYGRGAGDLYYAACLIVDDKGNVYLKNDVIGIHGGYEEEQILKLDSKGNFIRYLLRHHYNEKEQKDMTLHHAFQGFHIRENRLYFSSLTKGYIVWSIPLDEQEIITEKHKPKSLIQYHYKDKKNIYGDVTSDSKYIYFSDITADKIIKIHRNTGKTISSDRFTDTEPLNDPFYMTIRDNSPLVVGDVSTRRLILLNRDTLNPIWTVLLRNSKKDFLLGNVIMNSKNDIIALDQIKGELHYYNLNGKHLKIIRTFHRTSYNLPLGVIIAIGLSIVIYYTRRSIGEHLRNIRFTFFSKQVILFVPMIILATLLTGYLIYQSMSAVFENQVKEKLMGIASSIAYSLPVKEFNELNRETRILTPQYEEVYKKVSHLVYSRGLGFTDKLEFRWHKVVDGNLYYGVDRYRGGIMSAFFVQNKRYLNAVKTHRVDIFVYENLFFHREYLVALIPIISPDGNFSLFALQEDAVIFDELKEKIFIQVLQIMIIIVILMILVLILYSRMTTRPLQNLSKHLSGVTQGKLQPIDMRIRRDEIGDVARAYNYMADEMIKKQKQLSNIEVNIHGSIKNKLDSARNYIDNYISSYLGARDGQFEELNHVYNLITHCSKEGVNIMNTLRHINYNVQQLSEDLEYKAYNAFNTLIKIPYYIQFNHLNTSIIIRPDLVQYILDVYDEILNNIVKHSKATEVIIQLEMNKNLLRLSVKDNGIGFDPKSNKKNYSYGIDMMKERSQDQESKLTIQSIPGEGTFLELEIHAG